MQAMLLKHANIHASYFIYKKYTCDLEDDMMKYPSEIRN